MNDAIVIVQKDTDSFSMSDAVTAYLPLIRRVARGLLRNPHDAEDAEQETVCLILKNQTQFSKKGSVEGWVRQIAVRVCLRILRRRKWTAWLFEEVPAPAPHEPPDNDEITGLYAALDRLSNRERTVFVLHYQEGVPFAEVALTLGCTEGAARNYAFRASAKLREILGKQNG